MSSIWKAASDPNASRINRRGTVKEKKVKYPLFEDMSNMCNDKYWKYIFSSCSIGKFPKSFTYKDDTLHCRSKKASIQITDNIEEMIPLIINFFQTNGGLYSEDDINEMNNERLNILGVKLDKENNDWSSISKSKNKKINAIDEYIDKMDISKELKDRLFTLINLGMSSGYINKNHIDYKGGEIKHIDGFDIIDNEVVYTRKLTAAKSKASKASTKIKQQDYYALWLKYLNEVYYKLTKDSCKKESNVSSRNYVSSYDVSSE